MKDLMDKLSSYNLFNYLLPGVVFVVVLKAVTSYDLIQKDLVVGVFFYYFIGLVVSRIGSVLLEPLLKSLRFLKFSEYQRYLDAVARDKTIEILSEANNMYRTFLSLFLCIGTLKVGEKLADFCPSIKGYYVGVGIFLFIILFAFSYKKQTAYINQRVDKYSERE